MCFGSSKMPEVSQSPAVAPLPTPAPTPSIVEPSAVQAQTADQRRKQIQNMRYGLASTMKAGVNRYATAANIYTPEAGGLKTKMGE